MNILILIAGTNNPSNAETLANAFAKGILKHSNDANIEQIRLIDIYLEHFKLEFYDENTNQEKDFLMLKSSIEKADAIVIASPIWNFGLPSHLKNAIDRVGSFALDEEKRRSGRLNGKPFFCIFTGGASKGAWIAMMRFTTSYISEAMQYFGATSFGNHYEERCVLRNGKFGLVVDKRIKSLNLLMNKGERFAKNVNAFLLYGKIPITQRIKKKLLKFGEKILSKLP